MKKTAKRNPRREARTEDVRSRARLLKADQQVDYRDYEFLRKFMTCLLYTSRCV